MVPKIEGAAIPGTGEYLFKRRKERARARSLPAASLPGRYAVLTRARSLPVT
jgi:hypothetical protein